LDVFKVSARLFSKFFDVHFSLAFSISSAMTYAAFEMSM